MTRTLIVNADDFGLTRGVSAGIVHAHLHGLVTTTTVMVNMPGALQDVAQAIEQVPTLGLGVHLNLTHGRPITPPEQIPSLVGADGAFLRPETLLTSSQRPSLAHVEREWRAQIESFLRIGATLDHLDSHHHTALFAPELWQLCLRLAREYGCGVRPPAPQEAKDDVLFSRFPRESRRFATTEAWRMLEMSHVPCPDRLITRFFARQVRLTRLLAILRSVTHGVTELMCHPGWVDAALHRESGYAQNREAELEVVTAAQALRVVSMSGILLATYRQAFGS